MINRFRGPSTAGSSKTTAQTLCQKCLKRDDYECKASAQERPYTSRPSRTQQLANPKLLPKLTSDSPNELLRKKGVADEELAKKEVERGRKRKADDDEEMTGLRKHSRSMSSTSVSTISTNLSRSLSPDRGPQAHTGQSQHLANIDVERKRGRSSSASTSYDSDSSPRRHRRNRSEDRGGMYRGTGNLSSREVQRKKRYDRQWSRDQPKSKNRQRQRSITNSSDSSMDRKRSSRPSGGDYRSKRRRHSSRSPGDRGRDRDANSTRGSRRTRSPSEGRDRSQVMRNRKSMTPGILSKQSHEVRHRDHRPSFNGGQSYSKDNDRYGSSATDRRDDIRGNRPPPNAPPPRKERSLSPFSKRLALTQAMNMGR